MSDFQSLTAEQKIAVISFIFDEMAKNPRPTRMIETTHGLSFKQIEKLKEIERFVNYLNLYFDYIKKHINDKQAT